jgi:hypothetical protein
MSIVENNIDKNSIGNSVNNKGIIAGKIEGDVTNNITINTPKQTKKLHSLIPKLIEILSELVDSLDYNDINLKYKINSIDTMEYNINDKIEYNNVVEYRTIIDEYSEYCGICKEALNIIDNNNIGGKSKILRSINFLYQKNKMELIKKYKKSDIKGIDIIRENADIIIYNIISILNKRITQDNSSKDLLEEDIDTGLARIICYAFVECKILEKPRKDYDNKYR